MRKYYIYIMTNRKMTLYTGLTNNLERRVAEHRMHSNSGFTSRYKISKLVYFEEYSDVRDAISREKQIKGWGRQKKIDLISSINPNFEEVRF